MCNKKVNPRSRNFIEVHDHCYVTCKYWRGAQSVCNLRYSVLYEVSVVFHNGLIYDYHIMIKHFTEIFKCLREKTEKWFCFSVSLDKKTKGQSEKMK